MPVTIDQIRQAADAIAGHVIDTPCLHSRTLSKVTGAHVFLKFENYQYTASFKERGALYKLRSLSHQRAFTNLPVQTVEVEFVLQTRSHDHVRQVIQALARKGFEATLHLE